jgi:hypothetical protein
MQRRRRIMAGSDQPLAQFQNRRVCGGGDAGGGGGVAADQFGQKGASAAHATPRGRLIAGKLRAASSAVGNVFWAVRLRAADTILPTLLQPR